MTNIFHPNKIMPWILASRPKTLSAAFTPIFVATAVAISVLRSTEFKVTWTYSLFALLASIFIQIWTKKSYAKRTSKFKTSYAWWVY